MNEPTTLQEAMQYFSDPHICLEFVSNLRWPDGVRCPICGSMDVRFIPTRRLWECKDRHDRRQFSVKVGTIFEDSPIGLDKWLAAMWIIANAKNGVSSWEMHRTLGVTQKTAWFMLHRIRLAMQTRTFAKFGGEVEADETFIGGKARFMHKKRRAVKIKGTGGVDKTAVMGLLERHGPQGHSQIKAKVVPNIRKRTLREEVSQHVEKGSEVFTDALASYNALKEDFVHQVIDHAEAYAKGKVHTNGLENFWSLLKRAIKGSYVNVEPFHLFRYLDEESFRFNNREDNDAGRFRKLVGQIIGRKVTYKQLIGIGLPATTPA